jgi:ATP-binding cassette subfamily B protein
MAVRKLLLAAVKKYWPAATVGTILMVAVTLVGLVPPLVMRSIVDEAIPSGDLGVLAARTALLAALYAAGAGLSLASSTLFVVTSQRVLHQVRRSVFRHVVSLPLEILEKNQTGYLTARMNEITALGPLFGAGAFKTIISVFEFFGVLVIVFTLNTPLTLILLAFLPAYYVATRYVSGGYRRTSRALFQTGGLMSGKLQETFQGMSEVKSLGLEDKRAGEAIRLSSEVARVGIKQGQVAIIGTEALILISSLASTALLFFSGRSIVAGTFTLGGYLAFVAYVSKVLGPFSYVMTYTQTIQPALSALDRLDEFLRETTERTRYEGKPAIENLERVEFKDVTFAYPARPEKPALAGFSLQLRRPGVISLVGPNGAGKSTVVRLLLGYYTTYQGEILINGRRLRDLDVLAWRRKVAIVSQEPFLFDGTVRENLELVEGVDVNRDLDRLAQDPAVSILLARLPQALDTPVGEGGRKLSGGQRQVVAILRALLREADVIIFDEATAHLDPEVKDVLRGAVRSLFDGKLCLIITHDLALATVGDTIVQLADGRVADGTGGL